MGNGPTNPQGPNLGQQNEAGDIARQAKDAETMRENLLIALDNQIKLNELEKEKAMVLNQQLDAAQKQLDINTAIARQASDTLGTIIQQAESLEGSVMSAEELRGVLDKLTKHTIEGIDAQKRYKEILESIRNTQNMTEEERLEALKKAKKEVEELRANMEDVKNFGDKFNSSLSGFGEKLGVTRDLSSSMSGNFAKMTADFSRGFSNDKMGMILKGFQQLGTRILASVADEIVNIAVGVDNLSRSLVKSTGFSGDFRESIGGIYQGTLAAGVSMEEASQSVVSLGKNFSDFNPALQEQILYMGTTVSLLSHLGVSVEQSTSGIQMLSKAFKINGEQATDTFMKIVTSGNKAGISNERMAADFQANFATLVQFGDKAVDVFKDLAAQSKATGVEMGKLVGIAQKFDTFEGAATQAAQLNSILGANVSALELMNADYAGTIELIQDGLSGVNFDELNRFEQQYIATAMGASSVHEAQMLLSGDAEEVGAKMEAQAKAQAELNEIVKENLPLAKRFAVAISKIAVAFAPLIEFIAAAIHLFMNMDDSVGGLIVPLSTMFLGFVAFIPGIIDLVVMLATSISTAFGSGGIMAVLGEFGAFFGMIGEIIAGSVALTVGAFVMLQVGLNMVLDAMMPVWSIGKAVAEFFIYIATIAGVFFLTLNPVTAGIMAVVGAIIFLYRNLHHLMDAFSLSGSPFLYEMPRYLSLGFDMLDLALGRAATTIKKFGSILIDIYKSAMTPFIEGFKFVGGMLGFNVENSEEPDQAPTVQEVGGTAGGRKPAASIQKAATEIKTLVVAQLKETGIQETADELAKIANIMQEKEPITNVNINLDGRQLKDFILRTVIG